MEKANGKYNAIFQNITGLHRDYLGMLPPTMEKQMEKLM